MFRRLLEKPCRRWTAGLLVTTIISANTPESKQRREINSLHGPATTSVVT
jgi:hypothetical protein